MRYRIFSPRLLSQGTLRTGSGLLFALCVIAQSASADVIEIGADGAVTLYNQPGILRDGTFTALPPPVPPRAPGAAIPRLLASAAGRYGLNPDLLARVAWVESRYRADAASSKGAVGVMQLMDGTARDLGVDRHDLAGNIQGGAAYLRQMLDRYAGNVGLALAAYNAGPGAVDHYGGVPPFPETMAYLRAVLGPAYFSANR
jgi:soluble lytic murein transglycosylase-like protein